jgi:Flp pilus assembly protein TadD
MSGQVDSGERLYADALAAEHRGDVVGALGLLRRCVVEHPGHAASWNRLGVLLLLHHRNIETATAAFERAVLLDPVDVTYRNNLGKVLAVDDHPDVASRVTRRLRGR